MHPILIDLGFFALPSYGLLLACSVLAAMWTLRLRADKSGLDGNKHVDLGLWMVIWALLGSKGLLIIVELPRYLKNPGQLLGVVRAGGVFLGGLIAGFIAGFILIRRYKLKILPTFDVMAPSLSLGQAIGRLGCLAAGCCWGRSCGLPWAITYQDPHAAKLLGTPLHQTVHPFPIYAIVFNLILYALLAAMYRRGTFAAGRLTGTYLGLYGIGRFLLEMTRGDVGRGFVFDGALSTSQFISVLMLAISIGLHLWISRRKSA